MKVLAGQLTPAGDPATDAATIAAALEEYPGADLAVFPELFVGGYETGDPGRVAIDAAGPELAGLGRRCGEVGTALIAGFTERAGDDRYANSAACFDQDGRLAAVYRKTHLFGEAEEGAFAAGDELVTVELAGTVAAPLICFDVEFPEPARRLARAGARLLVTIAANMAPYGPDHRLAAQARALDNRLPHVYVNRLGAAAGNEFVGGTCLIGTDGQVIEDEAETEGLFQFSLPPDDGPPPAVDYLNQLRDDLVVSAHNVPSGGGS